MIRGLYKCLHYFTRNYVLMTHPMACLGEMFANVKHLRQLQLHTTESDADFMRLCTTLRV